MATDEQDMKYNGKELIEMTPRNWDGKTREMLVWIGTDSIPELRMVVGYEIDDEDVLWIVDDDGIICRWTHCAEIPPEEPRIGIKPRYDFMFNILNTKETPKETATALNGDRSKKSPSRNYTAMFEVMRRYTSGEEVQYRDRFDGTDWRIVANPSWNWDRYEYRVKPVDESESGKLRAYESEEEMQSHIAELVTRCDTIRHPLYGGIWLRKIEGGECRLITGFDEYGVWIGEDHYSWDLAFVRVTYMDGTPFGCPSL